MPKRYFLFSFAALGVVSTYEIGRSSWRPENLAALKIGILICSSSVGS